MEVLLGHRVSDRGRGGRMGGMGMVAVHTGCLYVVWSVYKINDCIMPIIRYVDYQTQESCVIQNIWVSEINTKVRRKIKSSTMCILLVGILILSKSVCSQCLYVFGFMALYEV